MSELNSSGRELVQASFALARASTAPGAASAQEFPAKPMRLICPWPACGATDAVTRVIAESAGKILGRTTLVEKKPGASGMLGPNEWVKRHRMATLGRSSRLVWRACRTCKKCSLIR